MRRITTLSLLLSTALCHGVELDPSFSGDGKATVAFDLDASKRDRVKRIFPYSTGGYLLVGTATNNTNVDVALASIADNGSLSTLIGGDGRLNIDLGTGFDLRDAAVDSAGRIILVGALPDSAGVGTRIGVARLFADGSVDSSFGFFGLAVYDNATYAEPMAVVVTPSDAILLFNRQSADGANWGAYAQILTSQGVSDDIEFVDATFAGRDGVMRWSPAQNAAVVAFSASTSGGCAMRSLRVQISGATPMSISSGVVASVLLPDTLGACTTMRTSGLAVDAQSGAFAVVGENLFNLIGSTNHRGWVSKVDANGDLDLSFDGDGFKQYEAPFPATDLRFHAVVLDSQGELLVGGITGNADASLQQFALLKMQSNGALDTDFGINGLTGTTFAGTSGSATLNVVSDMLTDGDRAVLAGYRHFAEPSDDDFAIAAWFQTASGNVIFANGFE
ncbi:MAG: hypothetical protein R3F04_04145 [Lysobacteraceae bacterium]